MVSGRQKSSPLNYYDCHDHNNGCDDEHGQDLFLQRRNVRPASTLVILGGELRCNSNNSDDNYLI